MRPRELPPAVLSRCAVVYVRQSTGGQVHENLESQRRQYALVDLARTYGFQDVRVIDDDLGRSASGTMERPGFRSLVGRVCEGLVSAVFCLVPLRTLLSAIQRSSEPTGQLQHAKSAELKHSASGLGGTLDAWSGRMATVTDRVARSRRGVRARWVEAWCPGCP
jgi:hypothetical protein